MTCEDFMEMLKAHENVLITQVCIHHFPIKNHKITRHFFSESRLEIKIEIFNQSREIFFAKRDNLKKWTKTKIIMHQKSNKLKNEQN